MNAGVIVAAGKGERMGASVDKAFLQLGSKPVLAYSLEAFEACPDIDEVVLVVRKDRIDSAWGMAQMFGCAKVKRIVAGNLKQRQQSVMNGLSQLSDEARIVAVHDGARPCVTARLISETVQSAKRCGSGVAATPITDTVKYVERGQTVTRTLDRNKLWTVQTPQTFKVEVLLRAMALVGKKNLAVTDEASALELAGEPVHLVSAPGPNIKITFADDIAIAAAMLKVEPPRTPV